MNNENDIIKMLDALKKNDVLCSLDFKNDILKLISTNAKGFIKKFYHDMIRKNYNQLNRFEVLKLNRKQRNELNRNDLYRYEYRSNSNLRCIFTIVNVNNIEKVILLCAFNEDGNKTKGKNSYKDNIERAIRIYFNIVKKEENKNGT